MKVKNILAAAGLTLTMASFGPPLFAQVSGAGTASVEGAGTFGAPQPATAESGSTAGVFQSAPSAGQPGTEAPASAAPIGTSASDWMSQEGHSVAENSSIFPAPNGARDETQLRTDEVNLELDIVTYRAR